MNRMWKTLIISVALFQIVLTIAFWRMIDYVQWLHFNDSVINYRGLMDTTPGRHAGYMILGSAAILVFINLLALRSVTTLSDPDSDSAESKPSEP
ncbi:MAG: hypothetical protein ACPG4T_12510 [Nannocystaceae bacterium]